MVHTNIAIIFSILLILSSNYLFLPAPRIPHPALTDHNPNGSWHSLALTDMYAGILPPPLLHPMKNWRSSRPLPRSALLYNYNSHLPDKKTVPDILHPAHIPI